MTTLPPVQSKMELIAALQQLHSANGDGAGGLWCQGCYQKEWPCETTNILSRAMKAANTNTPSEKSEGDLDVRVIRVYSDGTAAFEVVSLSSLTEHLRSLLLAYTAVTLEKVYKDMRASHHFQVVTSATTSDVKGGTS